MASQDDEPADFKVVYFGPDATALARNLAHLAKSVGAAPKTDENAFGTSFEIKLGEVRGKPIVFLLQTAPMEPASARTLAFKGAHGVVFVAKDEPQRMPENRAALSELWKLLERYGHDPSTFPAVVQLDGEHTQGDPESSELVLSGVPRVLANTSSGSGVMDTLRAIAKAVLVANPASG